jgi:putative FmdB family regulatory protein
VPTYQYACTECGHAFEQVQSFSDDALTTCPECTGRLRKVFNAVGVVFKGSGFYRTDSRANGSSSESAGSGSSSASDTKTETKTETKSGTKTETKSGSGSGSNGSSTTSKTPAATGAGT